MTNRACRRVWADPTQSQSLAACLVDRAPDRTGDERGSADSNRGHAPGTPGGRDPNAGCAWGWCSACGDPFFHDGTERAILRPTHAGDQTDYSSGKKKRHTIKNLILATADGLVQFLSDTYEGSVHDKAIADDVPYPLPAGSELVDDLGFVGYTLPDVRHTRPTRKPKGGTLTNAQKTANQAIARRRIVIDHVISGIKRCRIVKDTIRLWKEGVRDLVMEICCALHNLRMRSRS